MSGQCKQLLLIIRMFYGDDRGPLSLYNQLGPKPAWFLRIEFYHFALFSLKIVVLWWLDFSPQKNQNKNDRIRKKGNKTFVIRHLLQYQRRTKNINVNTTSSKFETNTITFNSNWCWRTTCLTWEVKVGIFT